MKKIIILLIVTAAITAITTITNSCASIKSAQSGSALWSNNCTRCHNSPPSSAYTNEQWEVIGTHMKIRANLTDEDAKKIVEFLKSGQ